MPEISFDGQRTFRSGLFFAAVCTLVVSTLGVAGLSFVLHGAAEGYFPFLALPGMATFVVLTVLAGRTLDVQITVARGAVTASFRERPIPLDGSRVSYGPWVALGLDTVVGVAVHIRGPDGNLVVGGVGEPSDGYVLTASPVRWPDCSLTRTDFAAFVRALGAPAVVTSSTVKIPIVRSSQTLGGIFGTMAPWFATIALTAMFGASLGVTGLESRLETTPFGRALMGGAPVVMVLTGLVWTMARHLRVKRPVYELEVGDTGLALDRPGHGVEARGGWNEIVARPLRYYVRARGRGYWIPAVELRIADARPVVVGVWNTGWQWPTEAAAAHRSPPYLVGPPDWEQLVAALRLHGGCP